MTIELRFGYSMQAEGACTFWGHMTAPTLAWQMLGVVAWGLQSRFEHTWQIAARRLNMRLLLLFSFTSAISFAGTWFGRLVDTKCYENEERNINPRDTLFVDRDQNREIRYCSPKAKTKSFTVVEPSGEYFRLDSAGNAQAADLLQRTGQRNGLYVTVIGKLSKNTIDVDSIAPAK
jgi:hypothetical protein